MPIPRPRTVFRVLILATALLPLASEGLGAQILQVPDPRRDRDRNPTVFVSGGIGWLTQDIVYDGRSGAAWDFGDGTQYRATLDFEVARGTYLGVMVSHARPSLRYATLIGGTPPAGCPTGACYASADVQQLMGLFRTGARQGFHQVIELQAGVTRFGNFENRDGVALGTGEWDVDFAWAVGYGFGYAFSPRTSLALVQDYGSVIHQRDNLEGNVRRTVPQYSTRLALRVGF